MAKKKNYLDELSEYQQKQYLPHSNVVQNGELPFRTRQLMKQGVKRKLFLFFIAVPCSFAAVVELQKKLLLPQEKAWMLLVPWLGALALALGLIIAGEYRRAKKTKIAKKRKNKRRR